MLVVSTRFAAVGVLLCLLGTCDCGSFSTRIKVEVEVEAGPTPALRRQPQDRTATFRTLSKILKSCWSVPVDANIDTVLQVCTRICFICCSFMNTFVLVEHRRPTCLLLISDRYYIQSQSTDRVMSINVSTTAVLMVSNSDVFLFLVFLYFFQESIFHKEHIRKQQQIAIHKSLRLRGYAACGYNG